MDCAKIWKQEMKGKIKAYPSRKTKIVCTLALLFLVQQLLSMSLSLAHVLFGNRFSNWQQ